MDFVTLVCKSRGPDPGGGSDPPGRTAAALVSKDEPITAWVMLKDQRPPTVGAATRKDWAGLGREVHAQLTSRASVTQAPLLSWLTSRGVAHKSFWIVNAVKVTADQATLADLAQRPDVERLVPDGTYAIPPDQTVPALPRPAHHRVEPGEHPGPRGLGRLRQPG
jgi:hypothetical protein